MIWAVCGPSMFGYCSGGCQLGKRLSIDNKDDSVLVDLVLAIEFAQFSF